MNIESHGCLESVVPIQSDLFSNLEKGLLYDIIVSNPPYVDQEDFDSMPPEFHHEPEISLLGGDQDGLAIVRRILKESVDYLAEDGVLLVEVGNSMVHFKSAFPDVKFNWVDCSGDELGVFYFTRTELLNNMSYFG